jgi:regulation of enolase protein 1 (concanavalin A-like superfamily)
MSLRKSLLSHAAIAALALVTALPGAAAPPSPPWIVQDIGAPAASGSTDVDATGVWTLKGSGVDIDNAADSFHFAYQRVKGDASIFARFLSRQGGDGEWAKAGLMVRENDTPGSPHLSCAMTPGHNLHAWKRPTQDEESFYFPEVGPSRSLEKNLFMRLQRVGQEIAVFYSRDGQLWTQADLSPQSLPVLKEEALIGLAVTSHQDGKIMTAQFDQVSVQPGVVSAHGVQACGGDRAVLLQWRPLPRAVGFDLYRGPLGASADSLVKLNDRPITGTSFTDTSAGLVNDTPVTYVVVPLLKGADARTTEGPRVAVQATPVSAPPGWMGCSINAGLKPASAVFDPATGEIALRASGGDIWFAGDQCYFLSQLMDGDVQITVKVLSRPSATDPDAQAGLMIRESLDGSARQAALMLHARGGLAFKYRPTANGTADGPSTWAIEPADLKTPVTLRLTRKGRTITPEYSMDDGKTFNPADNPLTFDEELSPTLYVGLALSSHNRAQTSQARFAGLVIKRL